MHFAVASVSISLLQLWAVAAMQINRAKDAHVSAVAESIPTFEEFVSQYSRTYKPGSADFAMRKAIFEKTTAEVRSFNAKPGRSWTAVVNKLADHTEQELQALQGWDGSVRPEASKTARPSHEALVAQLSDSHSRMPTCVSWTHLSSIQSVPDQASCGSCWAFAASKTLEAHSEIYGKRRTFSTEQIVSCTENPRECGGSGGCEGATAEMAFEYVLGRGCETEDRIPYNGAAAKCVSKKYRDLGPHALSSTLTDGSQLHEVKATSRSSYGGTSFGMTGWMKLPENQLLPLKLALAQHGPLAVSISVTTGFRLYGSGIFAQSGCPADAIVNHAVTLVGFGNSSGTGYWHILNSWGRGWGEGGFIRMAMTDSEGSYCGMDDQPQLGTACKNETAPVRVCGTCGILYDTSLPLFQGDGDKAKQQALRC